MSINLNTTSLNEYVSSSTGKKSVVKLYAKLMVEFANSQLGMKPCHPLPEKILVIHKNMISDYYKNASISSQKELEFLKKKYPTYNETEIGFVATGLRLVVLASPGKSHFKSLRKITFLPTGSALVLTKKYGEIEVVILPSDLAEESTVNDVNEIFNNTVKSHSESLIKNNESKNCKDCTLKCKLHPKSEHKTQIVESKIVDQKLPEKVTPVKPMIIDISDEVSTDPYYMTDNKYKYYLFCKILKSILDKSGGNPIDIKTSIIRSYKNLDIIPIRNLNILMYSPEYSKEENKLLLNTNLMNLNDYIRWFKLVSRKYYIEKRKTPRYLPTSNKSEVKNSNDKLVISQTNNSVKPCKESVTNESIEEVKLDHRVISDNIKREIYESLDAMKKFYEVANYNVDMLLATSSFVDTLLRKSGFTYKFKPSLTPEYIKIIKILLSGGRLS